MRAVFPAICAILVSGCSHHIGPLLHPDGQLAAQLAGTLTGDHKEAAIAGGLVSELYAGTTGAVTVTGEEPAAQAGVAAPWALVGPATLITNFGESGISAVGATAKAGVVFSLLTAGLAVSYWPDVSDVRLSSVHAEMSYALFASKYFSPQITLGFGHAFATDLGGRPRRLPQGRSASYGIGARSQIWRSVAVGADVAIRTDGGGWNGEWRILAGYRARDWRPTQETDVEVDVGTFWMIPLRGPWRFVDPAYSLGVSQAFSPKLAGALSLAFIHWQIPGEALFRSYLWDTGMFLALPGLRFSPGPRGLFGLTAGPAVAAMGEGPDNGATVGAHVDVAVPLRELVRLPLTFGVGGLWLARSESNDASVNAHDQVGVLIKGSVRF